MTRLLNRAQVGLEVKHDVALLALLSLPSGCVDDALVITRWVLGVDVLESESDFTPKKKSRKGKKSSKDKKKKKKKKRRIERMTVAQALAHLGLTEVPESRRQLYMATYGRMKEAETSTDENFPTRGELREAREILKGALDGLGT